MLRFVLLANALVLNAYRADNFTRPWLGLACVLAMVVWTPVASWLFTAAARRRLPWLVLDLALAVGLIVVSPVVKGAGFHATVSSFWVVGALMAWAVHYRWRGGLLAAGCLALADVAVRQDVTQANAGNVFLLLLGGLIVGSMAESLQLMATERDRALLTAAVAGERARLARAVHDGVLQVLGLVQRADPASELGRAAGAQEAALRALIREQSSTATGPTDAGTDLAAALARFGRRRGVSVSAPAHAVDVATHTADELVAAVGACLDNVARHAPGASAWVLLEELPERLEVSVRDDGPGFPAGRLEAAQAEGRLGVSESIRGRLADLGGTARVSSGPEGTEWELSLPRP